MANDENLKKRVPFVKGDPRINYEGRKKLPTEIEIFAEIFAEEKEGVTALEAIIKVLRSQASKGNLKAIEMVLDRLFGKVKQNYELTGKDGKDLIPPLIQVEILKGNGTKENPA